MTYVPDLWWSPSRGLFIRRPGATGYLPAFDEYERPLVGRRVVSSLPPDAIRLCADMGSEYLRVGELVSTEDRSDTYRLANGPQTMHLEPVDTDQPHVIDIVEEAWTMKHPVTCRARLFHCPVHKAAVTSEPFALLGRFTCTVNYDGRLILGEETT